MDRVAALHAARRCNLPKTQYALPGPQTFVNLDMVDDVLGVEVQGGESRTFANSTVTFNASTKALSGAANDC